MMQKFEKITVGNKKNQKKLVVVLLEVYAKSSLIQ